MTAAEVSMERLLTSVRSASASLLPAPRLPADERDGVWLPAGRFELRLDDEKETK